MQKKNFLQRLWGHFKTITIHRHLVMYHCFRCGMYKQGLLHDLSKYSPTEFLAGVKYYQGYRSPIAAEKEETGRSAAWCHHKGHNKHHWQYWSDNMKDGKLAALTMPDNYFLESLCDRIAACKTYHGKSYKDEDSYIYHRDSKERDGMHPDDCARMDILLKYLAEHGEKETFNYYKKLYKEYKKQGYFKLD